MKTHAYAMLSDGYESKISLKIAVKTWLLGVKTLALMMMMMPGMRNAE